MSIFTLPLTLEGKSKLEFVITEGLVNCGLYVYVKVISSYFFFFKFSQFS